eukprot:NODE_6_length_70510_cov_1.054395.p2 type:complete len:1007 gc:universal NODE_6_length_70510_cov_1.054395:17356-14336(-)
MSLNSNENHKSILLQSFMTKSSLILPFALYSSATHHEITSVLFEDYLFLGFDNGMIVQDLNLLLISHTAPISALHSTMLPDYSSHRNQRVLLSGCHDGQLLLWANDGNLLRRTTVFNHIIKSVETTDQSIIVGGYVHEIVILDYHLKILRRIATLDWTLKVKQIDILYHISFHGKVTLYDNYKVAKTYDFGRERANYFSLKKNSQGLLVGKQYLTIVDIRGTEIILGAEFKCPGESQWLYAQYFDPNIAAWSTNMLYILSEDLNIISKTELPSIFGGYLQNNFFHAILKEKMTILKFDLATLEIVKHIPLWNFTSDLYTSFEFAQPNKVIFGTAEGWVKFTSFFNLFTTEAFDNSFEAHQGRISSMMVIQEQFDKNNSHPKKMLITGSEDCTVKFWHLETHELLSSVACLGGEIVQFLLPSTDFTDLNNCIIVISEDNSLSIVDYHEFKCKFSFSGMMYPIVEVGWRSRESLLLITCRDGSTYCWSLQTSHLDRVLYDHSREVLDHCDAHFSVSWRKDLRSLDMKKTTAVPISASSDSKLLAHVLIANTKNIIHDAHAGYLQASMNKKPVKKHRKNDSLSVSLTNWDIKPIQDYTVELKILQGMCSALLPWGLSNDFDTRCKQIGLFPTTKKLTIGITGTDNALSLLLPNDNIHKSWCISGFLTSAKLLAISGILKTIEFTSGDKTIFMELMSMILQKLPEFIGENYFPPSLDFLLRFYNDSDDEIKDGARFVFTKTMSLLTAEQKHSKLEEKMAIVKHLIEDPTSPITKVSARSLFLLGVMFSEFNINENVQEFCTSILKILQRESHDQYSGRIAIADLFLSNYEYWARFINKNEILDQLFQMLSVNVKDAEEEEIMSNSAQKALLNICFLDPKTFIKRLQASLFTVKKVKEKLAILKLLLTSISKDALFMRPLIPDIAYIVVKLLDPGTPHLREGLNEIIKNLLLAMVSRYPSVAFNSLSNKLAVGLENGRIVVYDVSSGTKAYVLSVFSFNSGSCRVSNCCSH